MNYVPRILYCSSLFFSLFLFTNLRSEIETLTKPANSPYLSSEKIEHWIIVHGTFARVLPWYKQGGSGYEALFNALNKRDQKFTLQPFMWSSENNHPARLEAAQELLVVLIHLSTNKFHTIHIVAHSHGGTVVLLAAQMLAECSKKEAAQSELNATSQIKPLRIAEVFTLGMPVHEHWYPHAYESIDTIYHLFSYGDFVQPVFSVFQRTLPDQPNVHNLQVKKDYDTPWHETLRSPEVLMQLPTLHTLITEKRDYCLHLDTKTKDAPFFTIEADTTREKDLTVTDNAYIKQIMTLAFIDSRKPQSITEMTSE